MNKNGYKCMSKTLISLVLVGAILGGATVQAASGIKKDESVYVTLSHEGQVKERIVSDWLYSPNGSEIKDKSSLKDIKNVKSDEKPEVNGESLTWKTKDNNIFYQGKIDKDLPLDVKITYTLNGQEVNPKDIAGKSGSLKIKLDIKNKDAHKVTINGKEKDIYTPFTTVTVMNLPLDNFKNVKVNSGEVVSDGNNSIVTFISLPGLKDSLNVDKDLIDLDLQESLEVTADAENFKLGPIMITATPNLPDVKAFKEAKNISELKDGINELKDASTQLKDGAKKLSDGESLFAGKMGDLVSGVDKLNSGSSTLKNGSAQLYDGISLAGVGVDQLIKEVNAPGNKNKLALITDDKKVKQERTLIEDAFFAKDMSTESLKGLLPLMSKENIGMAGKTVKDVRDAQFAKLISDPLVQQLKSLATPENMKNIQELMNNAEALNSLDINVENLKPLVQLMNNMDKLSALMGDLNRLAQMDTSALAGMMPLLDNAANLKALLDSVGQLSKVDIAAMQGFIKGQQSSGEKLITESAPLLDDNNIKALNVAIDKAYPLDNEATKAVNAQLKKLFAGYVDAIKETRTNVVNSKPALDEAAKNLAMLAEFQKGLAANAGSIEAASKALSQDNVKSIKAMAGALNGAKQKLSDPETMKLLQSLNAVMNDKKVIGELNKINAVLPQIGNMKQSLKNNENNIKALKMVIAKTNDPEVQKTLAQISVIEKDIDSLKPVIKAIESNLTPETAEKLAKSPEDLKKLMEMQNHLKESEDILNIMKESLEDNNIAKARQAIGKLPELTAGFNKLQSGSSQLYNGLTELNSGVNSLSDGSKQLKNGADELSKGASSLSEGMNKFDEEGITKLHDEVGGKVDDVQEILDTKDEIIKLSEEYGTFSGMGEDMQGKVKFIMKTDEVKLPEVKKEETKTVKEEKKGFIQWLKSLFS